MSNGWSLLHANDATCKRVMLSSYYPRTCTRAHTHAHTREREGEGNKEVNNVNIHGIRQSDLPDARRLKNGHFLPVSCFPLLQKWLTQNPLSFFLSFSFGRSCCAPQIVCGNIIAGGVVNELAAW